MTEKPPRHLVTLVALLLLTAATAAISESDADWLAFAVLTLAMAKMLLVAFRFMNLRQAHFFWKGAVLSVICAAVGTFFLLSFK